MAIETIKLYQSVEELKAFHQFFRLWREQFAFADFGKDTNP